MSTTIRTSAVEASAPIDEQIQREIIAGMKRHVRRMKRGEGDMSYANFFKDIGRKQPRSKHPMRRYPDVADAMARCGAPMADVIAPIDFEKARVIATHYADTLPPLDEAQMMEFNAQCAFDIVQYRIGEAFARLGYIPKTLVVEAEETASAHANAIHVLQAVCLRYAR